MRDKIKVIDTDYTIHVGTQEDYSKLEYGNLDGYCELHTKDIYIRTGYEDDPTCSSNILEYKKKVLRHELIHAIFWEFGQCDYSNDEDLVDFIAAIYPKIEKVMNQIDAIDLGKNNV